jgi:hypothetical protein
MPKKAPEPKIEIPQDAAPPAPPEGYGAEEWNALMPGEREGILEEIKDPEIGGPEDRDEEEIDETALAAIAAEPEKPPGKPAVEKPPEKPPEVPPVVAAPEKPPETPAPEKPAVEAVVLSDDDLLSFRAVVPDAELPNIDTVPVDLQAKLDEVDEKYNAGDMQLSDYNRQRDQINRQVVMQNIQARDAAKTEKGWEKEQAYFLGNRPEYLDNKTIKGQALFGALQGAVKTLGADPKNAHWSGMKLLIEADKAVKEAFGIGKPVVAPAAPEAKPKPTVKPPAPLPDHKTLGGLPPAAPNQIEDAFAQIDKLEGQAFEDAIARMTPAQKAAFEARV